VLYRDAANELLVFAFRLRVLKSLHIAFNVPLQKLSLEVEFIGTHIVWHDAFRRYSNVRVRRDSELFSSMRFLDLYFKIPDEYSPSAIQWLYALTIVHDGPELLASVPLLIYLQRTFAGLNHDAAIT
jgi:hypothetical protein